MFGIVAIFLFVIYDVFNLKSSRHSPGMIGLWPTFGGTLQNQQQPPSSVHVSINTDNVHNLQSQCVYQAPGGLGFGGYPAIDDDENAYFADMSGYITSIDLDSCDVLWRSHIGTLVGYDDNMKVVTFQSLTLFQDSNGDTGALFGAPQSRGWGSTLPGYSGCWAVAVHLKNGSLWWRIDIGEPGNVHDFKCSSHGFYVDGKFAYGGMSQSSWYDATNGSRFLGRYLKIDIDSHEIVNIWYPFNINKTEYDDWNTSYLGIGAYNFPAMMDDYLVFGTANLQTTPKYIDECLLYGQNTNISEEGFSRFLPLIDSQYIDLCGTDQSKNRFWRCLEKNIFTDSLIILNKTNFEQLQAFPLQGCDVYYGGAECRFNPDSSKFCPSLGNQGVNADLTAVATFKNESNGKSYVVASQKSGRLHLFELATGTLIFSRKYCPGILSGTFNMAIDPDSMVGIAVYSARHEEFVYASSKLANNVTICDGTGVLHAFDMNTGNTIYQIVNPYGTINESKCLNDSNYIDSSITDCEYGDFLPASETAYDKVIIPPTSNDQFIPKNAKSRAFLRGPVTIVNDMVFIPSSTGDIWVHHLLNGSFIHHFTCPNMLVNATTNQWNRFGIKGGISIVHDRVAFYCGVHNEHENDATGNTFVSMKLGS